MSAEHVTVVLAVALLVLTWWSLQDSWRAKDLARANADWLERKAQEIERWKEKCRQLESAAAVPTSAPRSVPCQRATTLKAETFCRVWREWPAEDERLQAVQQLLALEIVQAVDRVSDVRLAGRPGELAHAAGGLEHLLTLSANLDAVRVRPEQWVGGKE